MCLSAHPHIFGDFCSDSTRYRTRSASSLSDSCSVAPYHDLVIPRGDPKAFHLLAPYSTDPKKWGTQVWTDAYSGAESGVVTGPNYLSGILSIRSLADIKAQFLAHGEVKSETPDGEPAGARARGVLSRRHVSPSQIVLIGKESNRLDEVAAGLHSDWREILEDYRSRNSRPSSDILASTPALGVAEACNVSVRTVREWPKRGAKHHANDDRPGVQIGATMRRGFARQTK